MYEYETSQCVCFVERKTNIVSNAFIMTFLSNAHCHLCIGILVLTPEYNHLLYILLIINSNKFTRNKMQQQQCAKGTAMSSPQIKHLHSEYIQDHTIMKAAVRLWSKAVLKEWLFKCCVCAELGYHTNTWIQVTNANGNKGRKPFHVVHGPITNTALLPIPRMWTQKALL